MNAKKSVGDVRMSRTADYKYEELFGKSELLGLIDVLVDGLLDVIKNNDVTYR